MAISTLKHSLLSFTAILSVLTLSACFDDEKKTPTEGNNTTNYIASDYQFERIATIPVYLNTDINEHTVADSVAATTDGDTLIYTNSSHQQLGFIDLTDAINPEADGVLALNGTPHDIEAAGNFALVTVDTSANNQYPSGELAIINIDSRNLVNTLALDGQPDSISISPDQRYAVVTIENQRDVTLGDGSPPQLPAGYIYIIDMVGEPANWVYRHIQLTGIAELYSADPEPESVDINSDNIAAITLQENNHIVLIELSSGEIINHFSAGSQTLTGIDTVADKHIDYTDTLSDQRREPDGIQWLNNQYVITANAGDLSGGTRDLSIYNTAESQQTPTNHRVEPLLAALGHHNDLHSPDFGNQPNHIIVATYLQQKYAFISSRYGNAVFVHTIDEVDNVASISPEPYQVLPTPAQPSGLLAIPKRNMVVVTGQTDDQSKNVRSAISIYQLQKAISSYPRLISSPQENDNSPIAWGALSGLSTHPGNNDIAYSVADNSIQPSRFYTLDIDLYTTPPQVTQEILLLDTSDIIKGISPALVNSDNTVNLDLEGITYIDDDNIWLVAEGQGDKSDANTTKNLILKIDINGNISDIVHLPTLTNDRQLSHGLSGITHMNLNINDTPSTYLYVSFQRAWSGDKEGHTRIGQYELKPDRANQETNEEHWGFYSYPLETPTNTKNNEWVGVSAIANIDNNYIAVIERDNQAGRSAEYKRLYRFSTIAAFDPNEPSANQARITTGTEQEGTPTFPILKKLLVKDLTGIRAIYGGQTLEKIEGLGVDLNSGTAWIVNDNNASSVGNGETQLIRHGFLF